jgi:hypothetical protein
MGADIIGWRRCPLQVEHGVRGFLTRLKIRAYKLFVENNVPQSQRATLRLAVHIQGRPTRHMTYVEICDELGKFDEGIPACATCPLSGGKPVGCYRYVRYPLDAVFEELLFDYFINEVEKPKTPAYQIFQDSISRAPKKGTAWHTQRGAGKLAERAEVLSWTWRDVNKKDRYVDSAMICVGLFSSLRQPAAIVNHALFWQGFLEHVTRREAEAALRLSLGGNVEESLDLMARIPASQTLREVREVADMLAILSTKAQSEGWVWEVDA